MAQTIGVIGVDVANVVMLGKASADVAASTYLDVYLGGKDNFPCGFAWVTAKVKGSTKMGKALMANGFRKAHGGGLQMWNPSGLPVQNVDCKLAGAEAMASMLREKLGIEVFAESRWD